MGSLLIAYVLAWAATSAYIGWLAVQNARLAVRMKELRTMLEKRDHDEDYRYLKAA